MSDETNNQESRPSAPSGRSWTPPPSAGSAPPPPARYQGGTPAPDSTGGAPQPVRTGGPAVHVSAALVCGAIAVVGVVLGLFLKESVTEGVPGVSLWDQLSELWSIVAIVAAVATLLPALRSVLSLGEQLAWRFAAGGAAALVLWWVLFILPNINLNVSFLATVGVVAAVLAAWTSPGNRFLETADSSSTP